MSPSTGRSVCSPLLSPPHATRMLLHWSGMRTLSGKQSKASGRQTPLLVLLFEGRGTQGVCSVSLESGWFSAPQAMGLMGTHLDQSGCFSSQTWWDMPSCWWARHVILLVGSTCHPAGGLGGGRRSGKMAGMFAVADGVVPQIGQATKKRGLVCLSVLTAGGEVHTRPLWVISLFFKVTMVVREPYPDDLITL